MRQFDFLLKPEKIMPDISGLIYIPDFVTRETHLHPPLLASFTRAISDLIIKRNGVALIATHSPVVLQEVPKSCVTVVDRVLSEFRLDRPEMETFAENVGTLILQIFTLLPRRRYICP